MVKKECLQITKKIKETQIIDKGGEKRCFGFSGGGGGPSCSGLGFGSSSSPSGFYENCRRSA
jgi:hypothetical protein